VFQPLFQAVSCTPGRGQLIGIDVADSTHLLLEMHDVKVKEGRATLSLSCRRV